LNKECVFVPVKQGEAEAVGRAKKVSKGKKKKEDATTSTLPAARATASPLNEASSSVGQRADHFNNFAVLQAEHSGEDFAHQQSSQGTVCR
jgi:hypothetical protein